jgi:hypothetical protein
MMQDDVNVVNSKKRGGQDFEINVCVPVLSCGSHIGLLYGRMLHQLVGV